jgi:hypothetical protein
MSESSRASRGFTIARTNGPDRAIARRTLSGATIAVSLIVAFVLGGCSPLDTPVPHPTGSGTVTAPQPHADVGHSVFDIGCDAVATRDDMKALFGTRTGRPTEVEPDQQWLDLSTVALKQNGALTCGWGDQYEYGTPSFTLVAVPDFADGFERNRAELMSNNDDLYGDRYSELDIFDGSVYQCRPDYDYPSSASQLRCEWNILANGVWVAATLTGLLDSTLDSEPDPDTDVGLMAATKDSGVVVYLSRVVNSILHAPRLELTRSATKVGPCSQLIDRVSLAARIGRDVEVGDELAPRDPRFDWSSDTSFWIYTGAGGPIAESSMRHLGYRYCSVSPPAEYETWLTEVTIAPGGSWVFDSAKARNTGGIGRVISVCRWPSDDGPFCTVEAVVGDTLVAVRTSELTPVVGTAVLKNVVRNLIKDSVTAAFE